MLQRRHFSKAKKKSRFLEFGCEQALLGNADKLSEYVIGVDIYERGSEFNPQEDAIVRVQAHEIRKSLKDYYDEEGRDELWRIDLPPGGYVPVFTRISEARPATPESAPAARRPMWRTWPVLVPSLACVILAGLLIRERIVGKRPGAELAGLPESATWFWQPFLPPAEPPLVVIPVHPLLRAAHDGDSPATLAHGQVIPKDDLPEFRDTIHFRQLKEFRFVPNTH